MLSQKAERANMCLGIPGKVVELLRDGDLLMGKVDFGGVALQVCLEYVPDVRVNEYVVVHVGFALSRIDEQEALKIFELLRELDQLEEYSSEPEPEPELEQERP